MPKTLLNLVAGVAIIFASCAAVAQSDVALATRTAKLQALAEQLRTRDANDRQQAQEAARRMGIPLRRELPNGKVLELQRMVPGRGPVFYITYNVDAADTVSTDEVWPGGSLGLNLDGGGMRVAEWDGGAIYAAHPDFTGRLTQVDGATLVSNHSTHVAGTLIGAGDWLLPESRGMAYAAHLDAYDWNSDTAEMALAAANELLISNHSYGIAAGWLFTGDPIPPDTWWWIGGEDPAIVEDSNFGYYDSETQLWDQIAFDAPYYLVVKAVGNDRTDIGPAPGEQYTVIDQDGNFVSYSTAPRNPDCAPAGYDCLPTSSVAKNILTVGAADDLIGGYSIFAGPSSVQMADFSGWGPTDDGRIKPDVVGNGVLLLSAWGDYPYYAAAAGTSMSAPNVTGSLLLLQEHYQDIHGNNNFMRAATLKALAIHTADEAGGAAGPDYEFGWGLLNTKAAAGIITDNGGAHQIIEDSLVNAAVDTVEIMVTETDAIITATLVWADPPGTPPAPSLDPPDLMLVNDLDLRIQHGPATHLPWVLNPASPAAAAATGDNFRDNVEQVVIDGGGPGSYFVEVGHKGTLLSGSPQDYSLIISVAPRPPTGSNLLIDENFSAGLPAGWSVDTPNGISWTINTPVAGHSRLDNHTGGSGNFAMVNNNYSARTITSLQTPEFDLSAAAVAVLRFKSYFWLDGYESLNVELSTNGGIGWTTVWQWQGFNPNPTNYVLDLTGTATEQASVILRFRFDSEGEIQGNLWQVDDVQLEVFGGGPPPGDPPGPASSPNPAGGSTGLAPDTDVSWTAGSLTTSHDVYFGTNSPLSGGDFQVNQSGAVFDPGTLNYSTTYYWRVDEVNDDGTTQGNTWSFTTQSAPLAQTVHLAGLSGSALPGSRGRWTASVEFSIEDQNGNTAAGVTVDGDWSNGTSGGASCVTNSAGNCSVAKSNLKSNVGSVMFTVNSLTKAGWTYNPAGNIGGDSITVNQNDEDQTPVAVSDSYQTNIGVAVSENVISNDSQGNGPSSISTNTQPSNGALSLASDGGFTYTPDADFEGVDSFTYGITDQDGDISNTAMVSITVSEAEPPPPPPPPPGALSVSTRTFKTKGVQHVEVTWLNFAGPTVEIDRDGIPVSGSPTANDGSHVVDIGVKGSGQTYSFEVCETGTSNCASATASF